MRYLAKLFILLFYVLFAINVQAQSGGPPMMTDDPGVVDLHYFEINLSVNTSFSNSLNEFQTPLADINYGIAKNLQLKFECPLLLDFPKGQNTTTGLGDAIIGLKWKILDEGKSWLSVGTYPQYTVNHQQGFLLPLLLEKTFGKFLIGEDFGGFWGTHSYFLLQNGTLIGYKFSERFETMGEYFITKQTHPSAPFDSYLNFGCRYQLNKHVGLMGSFGTQLTAGTSNARQKLFSFLGVQLDL